jgi:hypothetical protein
MILKKKKIEVSLDGATFVFREPHMRELLKFNEPAERLHVIFSALESVSGVFDEAGRELTVEDVKSLDIPRDFTADVVSAYIQSPFFIAKVDAEKKA